MTTLERLTSHCTITESGCWNWQGAKNHAGYGRFNHQGRNRYAHRVAYEEAKEKIAANLVLDHTCNNRGCINPEHLEPVTQLVNVQRATNYNRNKTHCVKGHEFTTSNTYINPGTNKRACRECQKLRMRVRRNERRTS